MLVTREFIINPDEIFSFNTKFFKGFKTVLFEFYWYEDETESNKPAEAAYQFMLESDEWKTCEKLIIDKMKYLEQLMIKNPNDKKIKVVYHVDFKEKTK